MRPWIQVKRVNRLRPIRFEHNSYVTIQFVAQASGHPLHRQTVRVRHLWPKIEISFRLGGAQTKAYRWTAAVYMWNVWESLRPLHGSASPSISAWHLQEEIRVFDLRQNILRAQIPASAHETPSRLSPDTDPLYTKWIKQIEGSSSPK